MRSPREDSNQKESEQLLFPLMCKKITTGVKVANQPSLAEVYTTIAFFHL